MSEIDNTLKNIFGFDKFKPGQEQVVKIITSGESAASIFPTGAGKSLCYQLPAILEQGMTLVVSPLLSLMKDQIDFLKSKNIAAAKLDSGMSAEEYRNTLTCARTGKLKILMIAVERFKNERFRTQLRQIKISLLVVDEAHCISEWGHNFRPDYLKIPMYEKQFGIGKILLLTATATQRVIDDMCKKFDIRHKNIIQTGFYRENLLLRIHPAKEEKKDNQLREVLAGKPDGPTIVYVTLQKTAERVARMLTENGIAADAYHAGMKTDHREIIQNRFMIGEIGVIVATIAFGMGIDKEDIRKVIHYDLPKSIESYSQEIGRAGRDGNPSLCCMLGNKSGVPVLENFVYGDTPGFDNIRKVLGYINESQGTVFEVHPYKLSKDADIRMLPLKTLLVYLEISQIISPKYTYFESYAFQYLVPAEKIIANFDKERKQFVKLILDHSKAAIKWVTVDINQIIIESNSDRQRVLTALEYFHEKGWIDLQPKSGVEVFEILKPEFDIDSTAQELANLFINKEKKDVGRLHTMINIFETDQCLAKNLSAYFGEKLDRDCNQCSVCMDNGPIKLPSSKPPSLNELDFNRLIQDLADTDLSPLPVTLTTRFLCGISTPRLIQYKARQMKGFSHLEAYPYKAVEKWVQAHLK
ncbi:MAG: RecQ family ATP-dependent DNA helicase [Desulfobacteraceae bacterium]|nr:RecQ family ATP-dependent DNA helicase [Desulfobacteraceae bacterium]